MKVMVLTMCLVACADDAVESISAAADACEHFADGPSEAVTAGTSDAPTSVADEHTRYDITLAGSGHVIVAIDAPGDHTFFFDEAVTIVMTSGTNNQVAAETIVTSEADCADVRTAATYDLAVGTYTLALTTEAPSVSLVWFGTAHEH